MNVPTRAADLTITITDSDKQRCMLCVVGEVDFATSPLLHAMLEQQLACGRKYARVDMSRVAFIDTAGVEVLLEMHRSYLAARGTLVILDATPKLRCLLRLLELDSVLLVAADTAARRSVLDHERDVSERDLVDARA